MPLRVLTQTSVSQLGFKHKGKFERRWRAPVGDTGYPSDDTSAGKVRHFLPQLQARFFTVEVIGTLAKPRHFLRSITRAAGDDQVIIRMALSIGGEQLLLSRENTLNLTGFSREQGDLIMEETGFRPDQLLWILLSKGHIEPAGLVGMDAVRVIDGDVCLVPGVTMQQIPQPIGDKSTSYPTAQDSYLNVHCRTPVSK